MFQAQRHCGLRLREISFSVDTVPKLNSTTFSKLSDVAPTTFWSPYYP